MIHYSAPGKQFISGEWSILEMGNVGVVAAVNKRVHAVVQAAEKITISIDDFAISGLEADWNGKEIVISGGHEKEKLQFIKESMETTLRFLQDKGIKTKPFKIRSWGELSQIIVNGEAKKIGFGSSASVTVAVTAVLLDYHGYEASKEEIYKLATIAHYFAQGKVGSAFDVAASTYGGVFAYSRFDPGWLTSKIERVERIADIVKEKWPGFFVEQLEVPADFYLLIAWTGESFSTSAAIKKMNEFKAADSGQYQELIGRVANTARSVADYWKRKERSSVLELLRKNEDYLRELGEKSGVPIETPALKLLADIANKCGAAGKLSGSGGGDCGIGVCFDDRTAGKVKEEWEKAGLYFVDATIDYEGVKKH
ncbi:MAG: phosphomevalonate kinase [Candidatus Aenigmarchaeota archaeon]|nr:phosphomevalonate kinase [Candidatus Aenigmarchaeota archaeon]